MLKRNNCLFDQAQYYWLKYRVIRFIFNYTMTMHKGYITTKYVHNEHKFSEDPHHLINVYRWT